MKLLKLFFYYNLKVMYINNLFELRVFEKKFNSKKKEEFWYISNISKMLANFMLMVLCIFQFQYIVLIIILLTIFILITIDLFLIVNTITNN